MKIAIITSYWNPPNFVGGISRVIFELRKEWQQMGHTVHIYCNTVHDDKNGVFRIPIPPVPFRGLWMNLYMLLFSSLNKYDVLFPQCADQCILLNKKKCVPFVHTLYKVEHLVPWRFWKYAITPLEKYALRNILGCIVLDSKSAEDLKTDYHVQDNKILQVSNGVDYEFFSPAIEESPKDFVILSAGRFIPRKRFDFLIKVFASFVALHKNAKLIIAGDGGMRDELYALVHSLHLDGKVVFPGMVDEHIMLKLYQEASIFVLPSSAEGMPMVVLEAQACALPVVLADFESAHNLVIEGKTGYVLTDMVLDNWVSVLSRFYDQPDLIRSFGGASRERIKHEFGWTAVANKIGNYLQDITSQA